LNQRTATRNWEDQTVKKRFYLDKTNGMAMGVCSGLANYIGVDVTFVRIAAVLLTAFGAAPWTLIAYGIAAWVAKPALIGDRSGPELGAPRGSTHDYRAHATDLDRRLAEVDTYVATTDHRLAREIDELR
jgi:phage shock protein C